MNGPNQSAVNLSALPGWVPVAARNYLVHTECGLPIRALARTEDCHASTILRQVRRYESRRDDPLVDGALRRLSRMLPDRSQQNDNEETRSVTMHTGVIESETPSAETLEMEGSRILRRLCEAGAVLAVARDMDKAVVVRDGVDGATSRTAVVDQPIAQAMALKDWITCDDPTARIARYHITTAGRSALKELLASQENRANGMGDAAVSGLGNSGATGRDCADNSEVHRIRVNMAESPLIGLSRRRDKDGKPFLSRDLVAAGERLREDFELAQMGPKVAQDWDSFLVGAGGDAAGSGGHSEGSSASAAKDRVGAALSDLGPGLGDVALRCCCFLEGMEQTEKRMGWSARSGKIVLRIALQRLKRHYDELGQFAPRIG
ncbi:DUF6456 domain-containing protein [Aestuariibius sp. HNIBRBA575]|uniref:DUF6456 domain-containing protein n=1 Tax=Aestuariibius sp. HNIBRBA575 TaxID=3233343 RepID=UPI0034A59992